MNFTISKKFGTENILIGKKTSDELIDKPDDFNPTIIDSNSVPSIAQLNKISQTRSFLLKQQLKECEALKSLIWTEKLLINVN